MRVISSRLTAYFSISYRRSIRLAMPAVHAQVAFSSCTTDRADTVTIRKHIQNAQFPRLAVYLNSRQAKVAELADAPDTNNRQPLHSHNERASPADRTGLRCPIT